MPVRPFAKPQQAIAAEKCFVVIAAECRGVEACAVWKLQARPLAAGLAKPKEFQAIRSMRVRLLSGRRTLGKQPLHQRRNLVDGFVVKLPARLSGESGVDAAHASVASEEERRRERIQVRCLRQFDGKLLG